MDQLTRRSKVLSLHAVLSLFETDKLIFNWFFMARSAFNYENRVQKMNERLGDELKCPKEIARQTVYVRKLNCWFIFVARVNSDRSRRFTFRSLSVDRKCRRYICIDRFVRRIYLVYLLTLTRITDHGHTNFIREIKQFFENALNGPRSGNRNSRLDVVRWQNPEGIWFDDNCTTRFTGRSREDHKNRMKEIIRKNNKKRIGCGAQAFSLTIFYTREQSAQNWINNFNFCS